MEESIRQRLETDLRTAMREGDTVTRDTIRYLLAGLKNAEIEQRARLAQADQEVILHRIAKQLGDAIEQYRAGGRDDLATREASQLEILRRYLPTELTDDELASLVANVVAEVGATGPKEMGKVMPVLVQRAAGRSDGRRLSSAARAALAPRP